MKTKVTSLTSLPSKEVTKGLKRLHEAGITPKLWAAMLDADDTTMQRLAAVWPGAPDDDCVYRGPLFGW